ncbi:DMT family transporter [uncultured Ferrovibrio sp.]|jgi:drug/metabolite transporter (DMT)-like permease|uniref:DMT family transporter n=1 Tax=uncultured Ferrovibrio sp. TaxID=1576913 RepID=UPI002618A16A|nr:DMT family transporter [uncultured Ferrovibrio sp.]
MSYRSPLLGMALVTLGAVGFGLMPLFARTAYDEGLTPLSLLVWRFALACLCLLPFIRRFLAAPRDMAVAVTAGAGYMGTMFFYFLALKQLTVALTVLILFTYPLFTILIGWLAFGERLTVANAVAAALVLIAAILILSPTGFGNGADLVSIGMAFIPPLAYALFMHIAAKRLSRVAIPVRLGGVFLGGLIAMLILGIAVDGGIEAPASALAWGASAALAVISTVGALGLLLLGAPIAGAERTAIAGASELVTALAVGVIAYGESLDWRTLLGAALIVGAIILAGRESKVTE